MMPSKCKISIAAIATAAAAVAIILADGGSGIMVSASSASSSSNTVVITDGKDSSHHRQVRAEDTATVTTSSSSSPALCSCTPTSYTFRLNFNGGCASSTLQDNNNAGVDSSLCFFVEGGSPENVGMGVLWNNSDEDVVVEVAEGDNNGDNNDGDKEEEVGSSNSGTSSLIEMALAEGEGTTGDSSGGESGSTTSYISKILGGGGGGRHYQRGLRISEEKLSSFTSHYQHANNFFQKNQQKDEGEQHYEQKRSRREQSQLLDTIPTVITSITFLEFDIHMNKIINQDSTYFDTQLSNGTDITYNSISQTLDTSLLPLKDQMDKVPGGVMMVLFGINSENIVIQQTVAWEYNSFGQCFVEPQLVLGDSIGWIQLVGYSPPKSEFCPAVTDVPTENPTHSPVTTSHSPVTTSPSGKPTVTPTYYTFESSEVTSTNQPTRSPTGKPSSISPTLGFPMMAKSTKSAKTTYYSSSKSYKNSNGGMSYDYDYYEIHHLSKATKLFKQGIQVDRPIAKATKLFKPESKKGSGSGSEEEDVVTSTTVVVNYPSGAKYSKSSKGGKSSKGSKSTKASEYIQEITTSSPITLAPATLTPSKSPMAKPTNAPTSDEFDNAPSTHLLLNSTISKLLPNDGQSGDWFGVTVSASGNTVVVGAHRNDDNGYNSGSAYVFLQEGDNGWIEQAKLLPSDGQINDNFGCSVSVSGDTIVVGARFDDDNGRDSGSAYVFVRDGDSWIQQAKLLPNDGEIGDLSGIAVSVSEDTAVVGAYYDNDNGNDSGSAYVFVRDDGGIWEQQAKLLPNDGQTGDLFGVAVSVNGDTVVVGATEDDDNGSSSGSAYVFVRNGESWNQQAKLLPKDGAANDLFGRAVSVNGDTVVVGAYQDDDNGSNSGSAYVFVRDVEGAWNQQTKLLPNDGIANGLFGISVSVSGDTIVVGAYHSTSGSAYVYLRNNGDTWNQQTKLLSSDGQANEGFGYAVSVNGDTVVVGGPEDDDNGNDSGSAHIFQLQRS